MNIRHLALPALSPILLALASVSCGGGGGGGDAIASVSEVFPLSGALTDASTITVSGRSSLSDLAALRVGGVDATTTDDFATWTADVPLATGSNTLAIEVEDADGNVTPVDEVVVRRRVILRFVDGIDVDPDRDVAWLVDSLEDTLYVLDPVRGDLAPISGPNLGAGTLFTIPFDVVAGRGSSTVYVADSIRDSIFRVDTATGDRTELSLSGDSIEFGGGRGGIELDSTAGFLIVAAENGLFLVDPILQTSKRIVAAQTSGGSKGFVDVAVDDSTGEVFVIQESDLQRFDVPSGNLTTLAAGSQSQNTELTSANALDVDPDTGLLYVLALVGRQVVRIDPQTSKLEPIAALDPETLPRGLAFDAENARLLVTDFITDTIFTAETEPGSKPEILHTSRLGNGPAVRNVEDLEMHGDELYYSETGEYSVGLLDLRTGNRRLVSGDGRGEGIDIGDNYGIAVDREGGRMFVADLGDAVLNLILEVDLATGDRTILAEGGEPGGYEFPIDVALLPNGKLLVLDTDVDGIFELDPDTGVQRAVTQNGDGKGDDFLAFLESMAPAPGEGVVFVGDHNAGIGTIKAVQLDSGVRTVLSGSGVGQGEGVGVPVGMAFDAENARLFVLDAGGRKIFWVDLETGNRTVVSSKDRGTGPSLQSAHGLVWDARRNLLFTHSGIDAAMLAVSAASGDRIIISK